MAEGGGGGGGWGEVITLLFVKTNHHFGVHYYSDCLYIACSFKAQLTFKNQLNLSKLFNYLEK